jgi:hypothetical protein
MPVYGEWGKPGGTLWNRHTKWSSRLRKVFSVEFVQRLWARFGLFWAAVLGGGAACVLIGAMLGSM